MRIGSVLLSALLFASCSTLETREERAARGSFPPSALAFDDSATSEPANAVRLALVRPDVWDPAVVSMADQDAVIVSDLLFDGLTQATADGRLEPGLATAWSATEDFYAWTFQLDTDRTTAGDVEASFERLRAESVDTPAGVVMESVVRIEVLDASSVRFVLSAPNAGFAWLMSGLAFSITDDSGATTGRFEIVDDAPERTELRSVGGVEDDSADGEDDDATRVLIDWVVDHETAEAAADAGVVDGAVVPLIDTERAARRVGMPVSARSIVRFYGLNPTSPTFVDPAVRSAVLAAVDLSAVVDGLDAPALRADGLVAPTMPGFVAGACGERCAYDPEAAVEVVNRLGPFPTLRIAYANPSEQRLGGAIEAQLEAVGFDAELVELNGGLLSASIDTQAIDLFPYGWTAPALSIDSVIAPLLGAASPANPFGQLSVGVDESLAAAAVSGDDADRWRLLQTAHRQALETGLLLPVAVAENRFVVSPAFSGVVPRADGSIEIRSLP